MEVVVDVTVTLEGVTVLVRTIVADGTVSVIGFAVVSYSQVVVVLIVVDGVVVTLKVAVGVKVTVICKPAMMLNVRIQAKVKPSIMIIQSPEYI